MPRIAYVDGAYVPHSEAVVHVEDRGFQFADGVYEVALAVDGALWNADGHFARLKRSLDELRIPAPIGEGPLRVVMAELLRRNRLSTALLYLQATRGVAPRNHPFPTTTVAPTLVLTARPVDLAANATKAEGGGVTVIVAPDIRWGRADIKSVSLLANILAKQTAVEAGAAEAWLQRGGRVTEGSSSNAWIVDRNGVLVTHPKTHEILGGIPRQTALAAAADLQKKVEERAFTVEEALGAQEAFLTSATNLVMPIRRVDAGEEGARDFTAHPLAMRLREAYLERARSTAQPLGTRARATGR